MSRAGLFLYPRRVPAQVSLGSIVRKSATPGDEGLGQVRIERDSL